MECNMKTNIQLTIETFSSEEEAKHRINSVKEIEFQLRTLIAHWAKVAVYYNHEQEFMLTRLLALDEQGLWLEQSNNALLNQAVSAAEHLTVVSSHHNIKIQFESAAVTALPYQDQAAFFLPLPSSLLRLQRREYFRLLPPPLNPLKCVIPHSLKVPKKVREVTIMDISVGGAALICAEDDIELSEGKSYHDCSIDIPEFGTITGTLVVKNWAVMNSEAGNSYKRAGCEFKNLDNVSITLLQRYIIEMQRRR
jgi:c-di-GMP-binding flagellar brake protein YcgR